MTTSNGGPPASTSQAAAAISPDLPMTTPSAAAVLPAHTRPTAHEREQDARRGYQAAIAAARDSLRRAEERFEESSAAIDTHMQRVRAAAADRVIRCPMQAAPSTTQSDADTARALPRRPILSPVPSPSIP
jgi:hypothetical protein